MVDEGGQEPLNANKKSSVRAGTLGTAAPPHTNEHGHTPRLPLSAPARYARTRAPDSPRAVAVRGQSRTGAIGTA
eukprot:contig_3535_g762